MLTRKALIFLDTKEAGKKQFIADYIQTTTITQISGYKTNRLKK